MWKRAARVTGFRLCCGGEPPTGLSWQDGMQEPEIGDSAARKGGRMRRCNVGPYPANFLAFGSPQPQFFHYNLFTAIEVPLVRRHPVTGNEIPGTASHWSVAGRTVRFRLNAAAALLHAAEPGFYAEFGSDYRKRYAHRCRSHGSGFFTVARCAEMVLIIAKCYLRLTRRASQAEFKVRKYSVETCGLILKKPPIP